MIEEGIVPETVLEGHIEDDPEALREYLV